MNNHIFSDQILLTYRLKFYIKNMTKTRQLSSDIAFQKTYLKERYIVKLLHSNQNYTF